MPDQFDADALNALLANYESDEQQYFAQYKNARRDGDLASAGEAWRNLTALRTERDRCIQSYNSEVQRANQQPTDWRTQEEKAAALVRNYYDATRWRGKANTASMMRRSKPEWNTSGATRLGGNKMGRWASRLEENYRDRSPDQQFDNSPRSIASTLTGMFHAAYNKNSGDKIAAVRDMLSWAKNDRRLDGFDPHRLVTKVGECMSNGATLDLDDPWLRGGPKRPGSW